jgi:expansin (peptidoglycan-binding protein)
LVACSSSSPPDEQVPGGGKGPVSSGGSTSMAHAGAGTGGTAVSVTGGAAGSTSSSGGMSVAAGGSFVSSGGSGSGGAPISSTGGSGPSDPCATVKCGTDQTCSNGTCMCKSGGMACTDGCYDFQNDSTHCGNCTTKCATDAACVDGACLSPTCKTDTTTYNGHVTHYSLATGMVACHYPTNTLPQYYGAMNQYDWNDSGVCGACVEITANGKKLVVQITDECPDVAPNTQWCFKGSHHIDLNNAANDALSASGNPAVTWKYVNCTPTGNIKYYFDKGTKQYYLAVTPMNGRNVVAKMEVQVGGKWTGLKHTAYNTYELSGTDYGSGALMFRTTDVYNHVIVESVTPAADKVVDGTKQFAACP